MESAASNISFLGRSPHGERGLKSKNGGKEIEFRKVAPLTGSVD